MSFIIFLLSASLCLANPAPPKGNAATCGLPTLKPDLTTNIVGGKDAIPYSWPWQVALFKQPANGNAYQFCGGALISNQWVMTAGHCFYKNDQNLQQYSIRLGVFNKANLNEAGEQVVGVSEIRIHPQYDPRTTSFDITLLKLDRPVSFTDHISPVCLPTTLNEPLPQTGSGIFVTGWGATREGGAGSQTLQQVTVPVVSTNECKAAYPGAIFENVMFCAGLKQGGKDSCQGDSGGPVVFQETNGQWRQIGITSWGNGCAEPNYYGVYSKVSAYTGFIQQYVTDL